MDEQYPLTVYFDASCELCHSEMQNIKIHDAEQRLNLVDCSAASFDDTPYRGDGITRETMMECLHVRNNQGVWIKGVSAFELLYRTVAMPAGKSLGWAIHSPADGACLSVGSASSPGYIVDRLTDPVHVMGQV